MSKQYNTCPYCGANLDPGERCDCPRASPGGHQYGNQTGARVYPNLPGLPEIVFSRSKQQPDPSQIEPGSK
jgi:hypothetical protein